MAGGGRLLRRSRRSRVALDERGGDLDGGVAILNDESAPMHMASPKVANALRYFVARVQLHDTRGLPHRLALTSALRGEGVTFVTRSLASVIAYDTDRSVAVVDFNWEQPSENGERQLGLADAVTNGASLDTIMVSTANERLWLVPAGEAAVARRPALSGSDRLAGVIDALADRFDHVLFDLPPVLSSSEAMNLAQLADAFVLVVRQGVTAANQVEAALNEMRGVEPLGVILNRFDSRIPRRLRRLIGA